MKVNTLPINWCSDIENLNAIDFHPKERLLLVGSTDTSQQNIYLRSWSFEEDIFEEPSKVANFEKNKVQEFV